MGSEIVGLGEDMIKFVKKTHLSSNTKQQPLLLLNHVSFMCKSVSTSVRFYEEVLGFVLIKRPSSFDFEGAWLFNHGIGIHLLEVENLQKEKGKINPKENHISFQTPDMGLIISKLDQMKIEFVTALVEEGGVVVDQLFFHDPDGYMIEICNCQNLPILPITSCPLKKNIMPPSAIASTASTVANIEQTKSSSSYEKAWSKTKCSGEVEALMMYLAANMMDISF